MRWPHLPPLVSVVVPAYNAAATLAETLRSVARQTYRPLECIVVDDGSSDGTAAIAAAFGPPVRVVRQAHRGVSAARNAGVRAARGPLIAFLDADDLSHPERLALQCRSLERVPQAVACLSRVRLIDEQGRPLGPPREAGPRLRSTEFRVLDLTDLLRRFDRMGGGLTVRREALYRTGGYDESLATAEDLDIVLRLAALGPVLELDRPLYEYRQRRGSLSRSLFTGNRLRVLDKLEAALRSGNLPGERRAARQRQLRLLRRVRAGVALSYGDDLLWHGDMRGARRLLLRSLLGRPSPRAAALYLRACVSVPAVRFARSAFQTTRP